MLRTMLVLAVIAPWGAGSAQNAGVATQASEVTAADARAGAAASSAKALQATAPAAEAHQPEEPADGATPAHGEAGPAAAKSDVPRTRGPRRPPHLTAEQALNERVRRLTQVLELDESQQARLREVLMNERREIMKLRTENAHPQTDRVGQALAILDRTREEIRAMLNEKQKKKYPAAVPRDMTAPASADVDYWMRLTRPAPTQGGREGD